MRPTLAVFNHLIKRFRKKHGLSDRLEVTPELLAQIEQENDTRDDDCFTVKPKLLKGITLEQVDLGTCKGWLVTSPKNPADRILYHIHGGGFFHGNTKGEFRLISYIVRNFGYNVFAVDYRLAPRYHCVDTIDDCFAGYRWLLERYAPQNIVLIGGSAGGNLVLALPQKMKAEHCPLPGGILAISPVVQFLHYAYSFYECAYQTDFVLLFGEYDQTEHYRGDLPFTSPYLSPLLGDLEGYPPTYLDASSCECLRDEARMMYVRLKEEGVDVEYHELRDFFHGNVLFTNLGYVRRIEYPLMQRFLNKVLGETK